MTPAKKKRIEELGLFYHMGVVGNTVGHRSGDPDTIFAHQARANPRRIVPSGYVDDDPFDPEADSAEELS